MTNSYQSQFFEDPLESLLLSNNPNDECPRRRWHDNDPDLLIALERLAQCPPEQQQMLAQLLLDTTDVVGMSYQQDSRLKNLGSERVMSLMRAKARRRWYDKDVTLHKAMMSIMMVMDTYRTLLGRRLGHAIQAIETYTLWCKSEGMPLDPRTVYTRAKQVFLQEKLPSLPLPKSLCVPAPPLTSQLIEKTSPSPKVSSTNNSQAPELTEEEEDIFAQFNIATPAILGDE
jgi:hypothetical protein